jgi:RNA polymerase sigma-70 factor (ECF subfamily)
MNASDEALVLLARSGDRPAFEELVRRTSRLIYVRIYLETGDRQKAEDLLQETYLRAYRGLKKLTEPASLRAWLRTIAHKVVLDHVRRSSRRKRVFRLGPETADLDDLPGNSPNPEAEAVRAELRRNVLAALRSLPEEYRQPLGLRYLAGADYETICTQLGLSNGSLRGLLYRGLRMLRQRLPAELGALDD